MTNAQCLARLRATAILDGKCSICRCRDARPGLRTCTECGNAARDLGRARAKRRRCKGCGGPIRPRGQRTRRCAACAKRKSAADRRKHLARSQRREAAHRCVRCGANPPEIDRKQCQTCLDYLARQARDRNRR